MALKFTAKQYPSIRELDGISEKTMTGHYKLYQGYVNKTNEILEKLEKVDKSGANQIYSDLRSLKVDLSFAVGGMKNHEIYFEPCEERVRFCEIKAGCLGGVRFD